MRRRKAGRLAKMLADVYLAQGKIKQALLSVEDALNEARKTDDAIWQAATLESKAAILMHRKKQRRLASTKPAEDDGE
jgi:Tfp pilus assembly protein PilF